MIDYHSHILPGVDDGAADTAEALAIAAILSGAGFTDVHCTPHRMSGSYEATPQRIREAVEELRDAVDAARIPLRLHVGSEYYSDEYLPSLLDTPLPLGDSSLILMEAPLQASSSLLSSTAFQVVCRGFSPVIAHPERCAILRSAAGGEAGARSLLGSVLKFAHDKLGNYRRKQPETELPDLLRSMGCLFQGNLGSFAGIYGERVRRQAAHNLRTGLYDCLGTDVHTARGLADWLPRALREVENIVGAEGLNELLSPAAASPAPSLCTAACR